MKSIKYFISIFALPALVLCMVGCQSDEEEKPSQTEDVMTFDISFPGAATRATDTNFEANDRVGVYVTGNKQAVESAGNYVSNVAVDFNGTTWTPATPIYWNNGTYDVFGYFPYSPSIQSVTDYPVSVATEQNSGTGYADSDFLWVKKANVSATGNPVNLQFTHRMSRIVIQLTKGDGYEGELPEDAEVYIHNLVTEGTVDLNAGVVTRGKYATAQTIHARSLGNHCYTAIVLPQRLDNRVPLVEVISYGVSYLYESKFIFKQGVQHNVQLALSQNPDEIKIKVGGELVGWE